MYFEGYGPGYDPASMVMADLNGQQVGVQPGLIQRMKEGRHQRGREPSLHLSHMSSICAV